MVHRGDYLPQITALIDASRIAHVRAQEPITQGLAGLQRPGFVGFMLKEMPLVELTDAAHAVLMVWLGATGVLQFLLERPHVNPELAAVQA